MSETLPAVVTESPLEQFKALDLTDPHDITQVMVRSGFFRDVESLAEGAVKIIAGRELGFGPFASMQGIDIVEGRMRLASATLGALVKGHPDYDFRVREWDATMCRIEFFGHPVGEAAGWESLGFGSFTIEEAQAAGSVKDKSGWKKYPRAMLWARAMSNGVNAHCPDVGKGIRIYTEGDDFKAPRPTAPKVSNLNELLEDE